MIKRFNRFFALLTVVIMTITISRGNLFNNTAKVFAKEATTQSATVNSEELKIEKVENTNIKVGDRIDLIVNGAEGKEIKWTSNNSRVISVDEEGQIIGIGEGTGVVTAQAEDNDKVKDEITFNVAENKVKVFMRIEGYDHTILPRQEVEVVLKDVSPYIGSRTQYSWGADNFEKPTVGHALIEVLHNKGFLPWKNTEDDEENTGKGKYRFKGTEAGITLIMLDGDMQMEHGDLSVWTYKVNNANPSSPGYSQCKLKGGEDIVFYYGMDKTYITMNADKTKVKKGEEIKVNIKGLIKYSNDLKGIEGVTILVNDKPYKDIKTDSNGDAVLDFDKPGEYVISATRKSIKDGKSIDIVKPLPITVNVEQGSSETKVSVTDVKLNTSSCELKEGETAQLTAAVLPENASNKKVIWKSSDENIAKVDENGKVIAVKAGETVITATTEDGGKSAVCNIKVVKETVKVNEIKLDKDTLEVKIGAQEQLTAAVLPENASNKKVTWKSSDENTAKVDEKGKVTGVSEGQAVITVISEDGNKKADCSIKVVKPSEKPSEKALKIENITTRRVWNHDTQPETFEDIKVTEFIPTFKTWGYISIKVTNTCDENKYTAFIVGLFDKQGKLVDYVLDRDNVKTGEEIELRGDLYIKEIEEEGYVIKGFVWDGIDSMNSLRDVIEIPIHIYKE